MSERLCIAVDAMGGDHAPAAVVEGAALACLRHPDLRLLLFGDRTRLAPLLAARPALARAAQIEHTAQTVAMDEKPSQALRRGRGTSMWLAIEAVRAGRAQAVVSAGNTGALMAMARFQLRTLDGIDRPAIASLWPTMQADCVVLDLGANVECDAKDLVDFAVMGAAFARKLRGLARPRVGLLNVGVEDVKGRDEVKRAGQILRGTPLPMEFRGFIEGDGIGAGLADVVVTDGFTGNVALKTAEGTAKLITHYLGAALRRSPLSRLGYVLARGAFRALRMRLDPRIYNGGVFLGLNGVVVKSHGGADATGFAAAIDMAVDMVRADLCATIASDLINFPRLHQAEPGVAGTDSKAAASS